MNEGWIVHICKREAWQSAQELGEYRAASLESEGFIHCSKPEQVLDVANRYYAGESDLVLLWIQPGVFTPEIRWEVAENGEVYPHLYGPLNTSAVSKVSDLILDEQGVFHQFA